jgi:hypothetical protein
MLSSLDVGAAPAVGGCAPDAKIEVAMSSFHRIAGLVLLALTLTAASPAGAYCLNACRDHCIGRCNCIAHPTPDCNCNVFSCNCDCCKRVFNQACGGCACQNSLKGASRRTPKGATAAPNIAVCSCSSSCCRINEKGESVCDDNGATPVNTDPAQRFADVDTDHSGGISLDEMIAWLGKSDDGRALLRIFTRDELRARYFAPLDKNHNGLIEPNEFDAQLPSAKSLKK